MQWKAYPDDQLRAQAQPHRHSDAEVEPHVLEAWDRVGYIGRYAVIARQDHDTVTVIPLGGDDPLVQYDHATALVDPDRMYEYTLEGFQAGHPETWTAAVSAAAVETYVRRSRAGVHFDDDEYAAAERDAISHEPLSVWTWLKHPQV